MASKEKIAENLSKMEKKIFEKVDFSSINWKEMSIKEAIKTAKRMIERVDISEIEGLEIEKEKEKIIAQIILRTGNSINIEIEESEELKKSVDEIDLAKLLKNVPKNWKRKLAYINPNDVCAVIIDKGE